MEQQKCTSRTMLPSDVILLLALQYGPRRFGGFGSKIVEGHVALNDAPRHRHGDDSLQFGPPIYSGQHPRHRRPDFLLQYLGRVVYGVKEITSGLHPLLFHLLFLRVRDCPLLALHPLPLVRRDLPGVAIGLLCHPAGDGRGFLKGLHGGVVLLVVGGKDCKRRAVDV